ILPLLTVTIWVMYSLARVIYAIRQDGLLPQVLSKIDEMRHTPKNANHVAGLLAMVLAGIVPLEMWAELTNIVTIFYLMFHALG
ncbi:amino acid permease, partial [Enterococcus faecalis]|nr:amino acid permease [Enterococcus faecalis]